MAVTTQLLAQGQAIRVTPREVTIRATGEKRTFVDVLIVGPNTLVEGTLGDGLNPPKAGETVNARCSVSSYRDEDQVRIEAWL